jgi:hypothetical protein
MLVSVLTTPINFWYHLLNTGIKVLKNGVCHGQILMTRPVHKPKLKFIYRYVKWGKHHNLQCNTNLQTNEFSRKSVIQTTGVLMSPVLNTIFFQCLNFGILFALNPTNPF